MAPGLLQREIRQTRPFASPAEEATVGLLRTSDVVRRSLSDLIEPHGITFQQYNVLRILRGAGAEGLPTLEIGERLIEAAPGVTRLLDRLEAKTLVKRHRCPKDARRVLCRITPPGRRLLRGLDEPLRRAARALFAPLGEARTRGLILTLEAVRQPFTNGGHSR